MARGFIGNEGTWVILCALCFGCGQSRGNDGSTGAETGASVGAGGAGGASSSGAGDSTTSVGGNGGGAGTGGAGLDAGGAGQGAYEALAACSSSCDEITSWLGDASYGYDVLPARCVMEALAGGTAGVYATSHASYAADATYYTQRRVQVEANDRVRVATREYATEFSDTILDEEFSAELCDLVSPAYFTTCLEELPTEPLTSDARSQCISATNWVENCMPASSEQAMGFACDDG